MLKPAMILLWLKVNIIRYWIENTSIVWRELVHLGLCCALYIDIDGSVCSHLEKSLTCQLMIWWLAWTDSVTVIYRSCFEAHRSTLVTWFSKGGHCWVCIQCSIWLLVAGCIYTSSPYWSRCTACGPFSCQIAWEVQVRLDSGNLHHSFYPYVQTY